jgi:hypothetical protein
VCVCVLVAGKEEEEEKRKKKKISLLEWRAPPSSAGSAEVVDLFSRRPDTAGLVEP